MKMSKKISELMIVGANLSEVIADENLPKRWKNKNGQLEFDDGWHRYNPNKIKCHECGSSDIEFLWNNGDVVGFGCNKCGEQILDK